MSYGLDATFRPISTWPGQMTRNRKRSRFDSPWAMTLDLLKTELRHIGARNIVIELALSESEIRGDGYPRAQARPEHPGVILSLESRHGPLRYPCDTFTDWQSNLRAIALALEALRKVDRYGVTKHGEQYKGWLRLSDGVANGRLAARGREIIRLLGSEKAALLATHPDHGGSPEDFRAVQAARGPLFDPPRAHE